MWEPAILVLFSFGAMQGGLAAQGASAHKALELSAWNT